MELIREKTLTATGAWLVRYALENLPISHTFGIPGVHNTELYDEINKSNTLTPVLVTHEAGAAFMADGISRTSDNIGTLLIVPSAGITHAMSGIAEAFLDGIPMLVISGGIRRDIKHSFQLHDWDQHKAMASVCKKTYLIKDYSEIVPSIFEAYEIACAKKPGPVFIEIPVNIQLFKGQLSRLESFVPRKNTMTLKKDEFRKACALIAKAKNPGLFVGWGAKEATKELIEIAETLGSPVATTLQGLSVFPGSHPLHTGMGYGDYSVPAAKNAFSDCDLLVAIGCSFGEIPTGSFSMKVPENLIHIDIDPSVFNKNYPAKITLEADAKAACKMILEIFKDMNLEPQDSSKLSCQIAKNKDQYLHEWLNHKFKKVNPAKFITSLRERIKHDAMTVVDDGNHTFLMAELFTVYFTKHFISPTDFNCMGYAVPATIGAKIANPEKQVISVVGDGAFMMTCMEIITAKSLQLDIVYFVFNDGELAQIAQGQKTPYNKKTCTILGKFDLSGVAKATGSLYFSIEKDVDIDRVIEDSLLIAKEKRSPVIVDVKIDYSKKTKFTQGVVKAVLQKFPLKDKVRFVGRALWRKVNTPD